MNDCVPDTRYMASPEFQAAILHCLTIVEVPVMSFGTYVILFKTPNSMISVKWLMLNLHIWSIFSDGFICFFSVPYILLPAPAGYPLGFINSPTIDIYLFITFIGAVGASVLAIYENRYFVLYGHKTIWKHIRTPVLSLIYLYVPLIFLPPILNIPDQKESLPIILSSIPCQNQFTYKDRNIFVLALDYKVPFYCLAVATVVLAVPVLIFACLIFYHLLQTNRQSSSNFSKRTILMQKKFAIALSIQSVFLLGCVLAPVCTTFAVVYFWYHNQIVNNFIFIILSLHGVGSTVVMVCVHRPYREFTFGCFKRRKLSKTPKTPEKSVNFRNKAGVIAIL